MNNLKKPTDNTDLLHKTANLKMTISHYNEETSYYFYIEIIQHTSQTITVRHICTPKFVNIYYTALGTIRAYQSSPTVMHN